MTYQISFSGGLGSGISALIAYEQGLGFNLIFADTLIEDEDLYRFNVDIALAVSPEVSGGERDHINALLSQIPPVTKGESIDKRRDALTALSAEVMSAVPNFVWLIDGRTPWDVYVDNRWIGNSRTAHCSTDLKTKPIRGWLEANAQSSDPLVLGMDWSEMDRIERAQRNWNRPVSSLLNEYSISRVDYGHILSRYGILRPRLYRMGYEHNNCGGYCCRAGQVQFERLYRTMPERYGWHEEQMIIATDKIGPTAKPFLRMQVDGELKYLDLKEFREHLERGTAELDMFSGAGCGCFTDE